MSFIRRVLTRTLTAAPSIAPLQRAAPVAASDTTIFEPLELEKCVNSIKAPNMDKVRVKLNGSEGVKNFEIKQSVKKLEDIYDAD